MKIFLFSLITLEAKNHRFINYEASYTRMQYWSPS